MVAPTNVRFPESVDRSLANYALAAGAPKSTLVVTAVREWLQLQTHPRIHFVQTNTGERRAALIEGPEVWTVIESWLQHAPADRTAEGVAYVTGLTELEVEAALAYWADNRQEIDSVLERHKIAQDEAMAAWERRRALDAIG